MAKMVKCKTCGEEIAKSAKACPKCGAKQKKHTVLGVVLLIIGLIIIVAAIGGNGGGDEPKKVSDGNQQSNNAPSSQTPAPTPDTNVFTVGDAVSLSDIVVTLTDVSESTGGNYMKPDDGNIFVICEFNIENNSSKDISVSSLLSFEAYVDDYSTNMSLSATISSDKSQLDGSIAAGKKMSGIIGYEVAEDWSNIEIRFTPDFWSGKDITFVYDK